MSTFSFLLSSFAVLSHLLECIKSSVKWANRNFRNLLEIFSSPLYPLHSAHFQIHYAFHLRECVTLYIWCSAVHTARTKHFWNWYTFRYRISKNIPPFSTYHIQHSQGEGGRKKLWKQILARLINECFWIECVCKSFSGKCVFVTIAILWHINENIFDKCLWVQQSVTFHDDAFYPDDDYPWYKWIGLDRRRAFS